MTFARGVVLQRTGETRGRISFPPNEIEIVRGVLGDVTHARVEITEEIVWSSKEI